MEMRSKSRWEEEGRIEVGGGGWWVEYMWRMMHLSRQMSSLKAATAEQEGAMAGKVGGSSIVSSVSKWELHASTLR